VCDETDQDVPFQQAGSGLVPAILSLGNRVKKPGGAAIGGV
jgi:hypothetical protein